MLQYLPILLLLFADYSCGYFTFRVKTLYNDYGRENQCFNSIKSFQIMRFIPVSVESDDDYKTGTLIHDLIITPYAMLMMKLFADCTVLSYNEVPQYMKYLPNYKEQHYGKCVYASHDDYLSSDMSCMNRCTDGFSKKEFLLNSNNGYVHVLYIWRADYRGEDQCYENCKWKVMADDLVCRKLESISYEKGMEFPDRSNITPKTSKDDATNSEQNLKTSSADLRNILASKMTVCINIRMTRDTNVKLDMHEVPNVFKKIRGDKQQWLYIHSWDKDEMKVFIFNTDTVTHSRRPQNLNEGLDTINCEELKNLRMSFPRKSPLNRSKYLTKSNANHCFLKSTVDPSLNCSIILSSRPITQSTSIATFFIRNGLLHLQILKTCGFLNLLPSVFCEMESHLPHESEVHKAPMQNKFVIKRYDFASNVSIKEGCAACFLAHHEVFLVSYKTGYIWASETNSKYADSCKSICSEQVMLQNRAQVVQYDEEPWNNIIHRYVNSLSHAAAMILTMQYKAKEKSLLNPNSESFVPNAKKKSALNPNSESFVPKAKKKSALNPNSKPFVPKAKKKSALNPNSKSFVPPSRRKPVTEIARNLAVQSSNQANAVNDDNQVVQSPETSSVALNDKQRRHLQNRPHAYLPRHGYV